MYVHHGDRDDGCVSDISSHMLGSNEIKLVICVYYLIIYIALSHRQGEGRPDSFTV